MEQDTTDGWPEGGDESGDLDEFERKARAAISMHDGSPREYSEFARLAFEFRGPSLAVEEIERTVIEVGARGEALTMAVEHNGTKLLWRVDQAGLWGTTVPPQSVTVELQSPSGEDLVRTTDRAGAFSFDTKIPTPYRLTVREETGAWATPWQD
jgi:hypothetical protein